VIFLKIIKKLKEKIKKIKETIKKKILNRFLEYQKLKQEKEINHRFISMIPDEPYEEDKGEIWSEDQKKAKIFFCNFFRRGKEFTDEEIDHLFGRMKAGYNSAEEIAEFMSALKKPDKIIAAEEYLIEKRWNERWSKGGIDEIYERYKNDTGHKKAVAILLKIGYGFNEGHDREIDELVMEYPFISIAKEREKIMENIIKEAEEEEAKKKKAKKIIIGEIESYIEEFGYDYDLSKIINDSFEERKNRGSGENNENYNEEKKEVKTEKILKNKEKNNSGKSIFDVAKPLTQEGWKGQPETYKNFLEQANIKQMDYTLRIIDEEREARFFRTLKKLERYFPSYTPENKDKGCNVLLQILKRPDIQEREDIGKRIKALIEKAKSK
jgi:hypothetical protein